MKEELDQALCQKYPMIFKDRHGDMRKTLMCWGFGCGDGWYTLIDALCAMISWPYDQAVRRYEYARGQEAIGEMSAVDVERARLAIVAETENLPVAVQVKEKYGTLRFYADGGTPQAQSFIEFAEYMSGHMCDVCGAPGRQRDEGWVRTLCDEHEEAHRNRHKRAEPRKPRNIRMFRLPGMAHDLSLDFIVGETIENLHNRELADLVRPLVARFNAEDAASETGCCADGRTVEDNLVDAMQALGFIKPVTVITPFLWDENIAPESDPTSGA